MSEIGPGPVTAQALARLLPDERLAFTAAAAQAARDENPGINTTVALLLTVQRLITEAAGPPPPAAADPDLETELANARQAIGSLIEQAESWQERGGQLDASHVADVMLAALGPWVSPIALPPDRSGEKGPDHA